MNFSFPWIDTGETCRRTFQSVCFACRNFWWQAPTIKILFHLECSKVIEFIRKKWGRNQELSDKVFTYKLTMLLAFTSASRVLDLQHLNIRFMVKTPSSFAFTFRKLHKAWKKGKPPPSVVFHSFKEDSSLCVVELLNEYRKRSEQKNGDLLMNANFF